MNKNHLPLIIIFASVILIVVNIIFTSDNMNQGFWMRLLSSVLLIVAMIITMVLRKKQDGKK